MTETKLKYNLPIPIEGEIRDKSLPSKTEHELWIGGQKPGTFERRLLASDEGKTYSFINDRREEIGEGNLLAGVLLLAGLNSKENHRI